VQDAVTRRKAVHDDAAKAIKADERKVQEAVINSIQLIGTAASKQQVTNDAVKTWAGYLDAITKIYAPGSDLSKNIDSFYSKIATDQAKLNLPAGTLGPAAPQGPAANAPGGIPTGTGVNTGAPGFTLPHFATGGEVPGPEGKARLVVAHGGERILSVAETKVQPDQRQARQRVVPQATSATAAPFSSRSSAADVAFEKVVSAASTDRSASFQSLVSAHTSSIEKAAPSARSSLPTRQPLLPTPAVTTTTVQHTVNAPQTNHFHGAQTPTLAELDYLNRENGWRLSRTGRS
jgi:hypothetical protein